MALVTVFCFFSAAAELSAASANTSTTPAPTETLSIGGAAINVAIEPGDLSMSRTQVLSWVRRSACAVTEYYDGFPVRHVDVKIAPIDEGKGVLFGRTVLLDQTLAIRVGLSAFATESSLVDDWVMTHEIVHLSRRFRTSTTGSRKGSPLMSSQSRAHKSAIFLGRQSGVNSWTAFPRACLPPAIEVWTTLTPGAAPIGAVRCFA